MPVIGADGDPPLPMEGALPPDLQGTLFRIGPGETGDRGALHAVELREGRAVSYRRRASSADAGVFWHGGSVLALPERGIPLRYSRLLEPEEFTGGLTVPVASHARRDASDGSRVVFAVEDGTPDAGAGPRADEHGGPSAAALPGGGADGVWLRLDEWDATGALRGAFTLELERATWQHDVGLTANHVVFIESPTERLADPGGVAVPFGWLPGAEGWLGSVRRGGSGTDVRWVRLDPCLVTHVLGAFDGDDELVLVVCVYAAPEQGRLVDRSASVVGPAGLGLTSIGGGLGTLERWRVTGDRVERTALDDRFVEYPRIDGACEAGAFRFGYCVQIGWDGPAPGPGADSHPAGPAGTSGAAGAAGGATRPVVEARCRPFGLLKFDFDRDEVVAWSPDGGMTCSEPVFVRAADGHGDDEGWLLTIVENAERGASDLYVLDASALGRGRPEAIVHLPERLPPRSHGEWVAAGSYR